MHLGVRSGEGCAPAAAQALATVGGQEHITERMRPVATRRRKIMRHTNTKLNCVLGRTLRSNSERVPVSA